MKKGFSVIVEGLDNVGKDTLIKGLINHYNDQTAIHLHYGSVKQDSIEASIEYSKKAYKNMVDIMNFQSVVLNNVVFVNRAHLGEMVYSPIYRNYTGEFSLECENYMTMDKTFLITLTDTVENLLSREDGHSFSIDPEIKKREIELFRNAHDKSRIKHKYLMNIDGHTVEEVLAKVIDFIEYKKEN